MTNADVLRLKTRLNAVNSQINTFYNSLNGQNPSQAQIDAVQERAITLTNYLAEVLDIIDIQKRQALDAARLEAYRQ